MDAASVPRRLCTKNRAIEHRRWLSSLSSPGTELLPVSQQHPYLCSSTLTEALSCGGAGSGQDNVVPGLTCVMSGESGLGKTQPN